MIIIVGLGNPGRQFDHTRHNAGFEALDFFAKQQGFLEFKEHKKSQSLICEKDNIILVKPQTFMNESGKTVKELLKNTNEPQLLIVHDDIDLLLGKMKLVKDSSAGGHKGVDSIITSLGTKDFARLKLGIATGEHQAIDVVLEKFSKEEQKTLNDVIEKSAKALQEFISNGIEKTMNEYNR